MGQQAQGQDTKQEKPTVKPVWIWQHEPPAEKKCPAPYNIKPAGQPANDCGGCKSSDGNFRKLGSGDLVQRPGKFPILTNEKWDTKSSKPKLL